MSRLATSRLLAVDAQLTEREHVLVELVAQLGLLSQAQVAAVLPPASAQASAASSARDVRRVLKRLTDSRVLSRLDRRVGGLRAGSSGYLYYPGPVGQRLVAYWDGRGLTRGRFRPEPGERHVRHRLAVSQLYVDLHLASKRGDLELLGFDAEPDCWRSSLDGLGGRTLLKPDAFVRVGVGAYEDRAFVEVDLGTESRSVIHRKLHTYLDYFHAGTEQATQGVFPRVVWLTNSDARQQVLVNECARLPAEDWQLFLVNRLEQVVPALIGDLDDQGAEEDEALS